MALHGDLHGKNILESGTGWHSIDPKGYVGDPAFKLGAFIRNPYKVLAQQPDATEIMRRRSAFISQKCGHNPARVMQWVFVGCVLGASWGMEDGLDGEAQNWLHLATKLQEAI